METPKDLKNSTLYKYTKSEDLDKSIAAWAELDRRFYEGYPISKKNMIAMNERAFIEQEMGRCWDDSDLSEISHDPREQS